MQTHETKDKIFQAAFHLFYQNGYAETGVQAIANAAGINKATFYRAYNSKTDLGLEYLRKLESSFQEGIDKIRKEHTTLAGFITAWADWLEDSAKGGNLTGSPLLNFSSQLNINDPENKVFVDALAEITNNIIDTFTQAINELTATGTGALTCTPRELALRLIVIYNGAAGLYRLNGNFELFDEARKMTETYLSTVISSAA